MTQILPLDVTIKVLFTLALAIGTQFWKESNPEQAMKWRNYIAIGLIVFAAIINPLQYFALNQPIIVPNVFTLILVIIGQIVAGAAVGGTAVGIYQAAKITTLPFRSTAEIMVTNSKETGVVKVTETTVSADPEQTTVTLTKKPTTKKSKKA